MTTNPSNPNAILKYYVVLSEKQRKVVEYILKAIDELEGKSYYIFLWKMNKDGTLKRIHSQKQIATVKKSVVIDMLQVILHEGRYSTRDMERLNALRYEFEKQIREMMKNKSNG